jgi:flagellum-specific peptidoglycan hydrolase FlgJ
MPTPIFFDADPEIPDAELLGYGDLIFDDGSSRFINGDPEVVSMVPPLPKLDTSMGPPSPPPQYGAPVNDVVDTPRGQAYVNIDGSMMPAGDAVGDLGRQNPEAVDYLRGLNADAEHSRVQGMVKGSHADPAAATGPEDLTALFDRPPQAPQVSRKAEAEDRKNIIQTPQGPVHVNIDGTMTPVSREGALPADVAARQANDLLSAQNATLDAAEQARRQEAQIVRDAALKRMGELQAEKDARQKEIDEQQARVSRWQDEQQQTMHAKIDADLISAQGPIGAMFSVIGAALLGAAGSDAGLRMIDKTIDRHVQQQMDRRDTALAILGKQIGSSQQAIAAGKEALYKIAADRAEQLQALTKADVFAAHSPEIIAGLRQKQLEERQKQEQLSLGKTLEKAPQPVMPKPIQVEKYGEAAAAQATAQKDALRALQAVGGRYNPETGRIENKAEILKNGIPGVGTLDTFMHQLGKLPVVGALPQAADTAATSKEGLAVRAALESLVNAEAIRANPGRAPTDADRDSARIALGMTTEEGTLYAIERALNAQPQSKATNVATYGQDAAAVYDQRMRQQGQSNGPLQPFGDAQPLTPGNAREQVKGARAPKSQDAIPETSQAEPTETPEQKMAAVTGELQSIAGRELPPEGLAILAAQAGHESADGASMPGFNAFGHKATKGKKSAEFMTTEGEGKYAVRVKQNFAQYDSPSEAVADHVSLLQRKYPDAWKALQEGDVAAYVAALKDGKYFTGNETDYLRALQRRL